jgi:hypothetical protein
MRRARMALWMTLITFAVIVLAYLVLRGVGWFPTT